MVFDCDCCPVLVGGDHLRCPIPLTTFVPVILFDLRLRHSFVYPHVVYHIPSPRLHRAYHVYVVPFYRALPHLPLPTLPAYTVLRHAILPVVVSVTCYGPVALICLHYDFTPHTFRYPTPHRLPSPLPGVSLRSRLRWCVVRLTLPLFD